MFFKRVRYELKTQVDLTYIFCFFLLVLISLFTNPGTIKEATGIIEIYIALAAILLFINAFFYRERQNIAEFESQYIYAIKGKIVRSELATSLLFFFIIICTYFVFINKTNSDGISIFLYILNMYSIIIFFGGFTLMLFSITKNLSIALFASIILWFLNSSVNSLIPKEYKILNAYSGEDWYEIKIIYLLIGILLFAINQLIYNKRFQYK